MGRTKGYMPGQESHNLSSFLTAFFAAPSTVYLFLVESSEAVVWVLWSGAFFRRGVFFHAVLQSPPRVSLPELLSALRGRVFVSPFSTSSKQGVSSVVWHHVLLHRRVARAFCGFFVLLGAERQASACSSCMMHARIKKS